MYPSTTGTCGQDPMLPPPFFFMAILQSPCPSVHTFVTDISASTGRNDLIYGFDMVTCTVSPLSRFTAHLLPVYSATQNFSCFPVMKTFVTVISASTGRNDLVFDISYRDICSVICFDLQFSRSTRPMTSFCIFIAYINTRNTFQRQNYKMRLN